MAFMALKFLGFHLLLLSGTSPPLLSPYSLGRVLHVLTKRISPFCTHSQPAGTFQHCPLPRLRLPMGPRFASPAASGAGPAHRDQLLMFGHCFLSLPGLQHLVSLRSKGQETPTLLGAEERKCLSSPMMGPKQDWFPSAPVTSVKLPFQGFLQNPPS